MESASIVVTAPSRVELRAHAIADRPEPGHILVESEWSMVSAGTELANYTGADPGVHVAGSWNAYPWTAGYGSVGIVRAVGAGVGAVQAGQRVFTNGPHAALYHYPAASLVVPVPDRLDPALAAASRMAGVAMTGPMSADLGLDRWVVVLGLGMVGNLAAQGCRILGARVIAVDPSPARRELARRCGLAEVVGGGPDDVARAVKALSGDGAAVVIDATGRSEGVVQAVGLAAPFGQIVILGTPRKPLQGDLTAVFSAIHYRWLSLRGALEWNLPTYPAIGVRDSLFSKQQLIFDWVARGELRVGELISDRIAPERVADGYEGLLRDPERHSGVLIDWRRRG